MGYTIQSFVAADGVFPELPDDLVALQLRNHVQMIPLGTRAREQYGIPFLPLTDEGNFDLPFVLAEMCVKLSARGVVAYIEAEIFGGQGAQAHAMFAQGERAGSVVIADDAINAALRLLGVRQQNSHDEFESVGLDKCRETDAWLEVVGL